MLEILRRAVSADVILDAREVQNYAGDDSLPLVVAPRSAEEAAAVMRTAADEGWSVLCAGAGTCLDRGKPRRKTDLVMTTRRMTRIAEYEPADLVVTVEAGVTLAQIEAATRPHKQFLAFDPQLGESSTIGGIVATAAAGPLRFAHGTPRDHVLGLQLITGDARIVHFGGKVVKNVAGYDVVRPIVGSRGTLGLVTELSLRLKPMPESDQTVVIGCDTFEAAADFTDAVLAAHLDVVALEIVSPELAHDLDRAGWTVIVRLHGNAEAVRDSTEHLRKLARAEVTDASPEIWRRFANIEYSAQWNVRLGDLPSSLRETAASAARLTKSGMAGGARIAIHAGDGIVRVLANEAADGFEDVIRRERAALEARGGTLIVARAARPMEDAYGRVHGLELMAGVKRVFDPIGILAPESFVV